MTAAGTVPATRVFILGAGVAGLQAIATARRLGAVVEAFDIRPAAAEQIRSLGAKAVELELDTADSEDSGGYAKAQGDDEQSRQREALTPILAASDVVITTAAIPGVRSPELLTAEMVEAMKPGSVVLDLAAARGGNCAVTVADEEVIHHGVTVLGPTRLESEAALSASHMFANNLVSLLRHLSADDTTLNLDPDDEITSAMLVTAGGSVVHERVAAALAASGDNP
jgi:NAD(P) transhydrogenase subunit alpha